MLVGAFACDNRDGLTPLRVSWAIDNSFQTVLNLLATILQD